MKASVQALGISGVLLAFHGTAWPQAAPPPVFPMAVTSNITPTAASATAAIQFRPQDVSSNGRVFAFAVAPASAVKAGDLSKAMHVGASKDESKADTPACVLAQLNASGQLQAVAPAQMQAIYTGALTSAGATVPILNGVSTPTVAGATFYVGYGVNGAEMFNDGTYRSAVTVPGSGICPMISSQTSLWWDPAESGWGINLNHQGNTLFATLFTYDASRTPLWLVMSNGVMQADGVTFTGDLFQTEGPAFNASPFRPIGEGDLTKVGTMTVTFQDTNSGRLQYTVNGISVSKGIQRQVFGSRATGCFPSTASRASVTNYQDLWWNPAESGWGINLTHQDDTLFATLFTYDAAGKGIWLVMSAGARVTDGYYSGDLYQTTGPVFNASPFAGVTVTKVGTMQLRFSNGNNGTLTYSYNGTTVVKQITRQLISGVVPLCKDFEWPVVAAPVPNDQKASTLAALDLTNVLSSGYPWEIPASCCPASPAFFSAPPGILKRWAVPIPVKTNGEPRAIAAMDEIERQLGTTIFNRTSIANIPDDKITRGVIISVGTTPTLPGESVQYACAIVGRSPGPGLGQPLPNGTFSPGWMGWPYPSATNAGVMSYRMYISIDGPACRASQNRVIHEFGHVLGMGQHYSGFQQGDAVEEISELFWNVLRTIYANPPGTPRASIKVP